MRTEIVSTEFGLKVTTEKTERVASRTNRYFVVPDTYGTPVDGAKFDTFEDAMPLAQSRIRPIEGTDSKTRSWIIERETDESGDREIARTEIFDL